MKYKVTRPCWVFNTLWEVDDIVELDFDPNNKYFQPIEESPTVAFVGNQRDIMKPNASGTANTFSEMALQKSQSPQGGFASSLENQAPVASINDLRIPKKPGRPKKVT